MQATIIHNTDAGRLNVAHMLPAVSTALDEHGWRVKSCTVGVGCGNDPTALTRIACYEGADAVFAAGGDGSVAAAASVLAGSGVALGILPCGTGNVWSRGLGLGAPTHRWSSALVHAGARQVTGVVKNVDVGSCNGHVFLLWAGIGLDGLIVHGIQPCGRESYYDINVLPSALRVFVPLRLGDSGWERFWS